MKRIIVDKELELQGLSTTDAGWIFKTIDSERAYLGEWLPFVELTKRIEDSQKAIDSIIKTAEALNEFVFKIKYQKKFVGLIGMKGTDYGNKKTEIGYWLSENYQKKGIITNSLKKLIEFIFTELELNRIQIKVACENLPSKAIPKKLNFVFEGIERDGELLSDGFTDIEVYSLLKRDWVR